MLILIKVREVIHKRALSYLLFVFCCLINIRDTDSSRCIRLMYRFSILTQIHFFSPTVFQSVFTWTLARARKLCQPIRLDLLISSKSACIIHAWEWNILAFWLLPTVFQNKTYSITANFRVQLVRKIVMLIVTIIFKIILSLFMCPFMVAVISATFSWLHELNQFDTKRFSQKDILERLKCFLATCQIPKIDYFSRITVSHPPLVHSSSQVLLTSLNMNELLYVWHTLTPEGSLYNKSRIWAEISWCTATLWDRDIKMLLINIE